MNYARCGAVGTAVVLMIGAFPAHAQEVACEELENPVYMSVGSTMLPVLRDLGRKLRDFEANPITLLFVDGRSCGNIDAMIGGTPLTVNPSYIPSTAEDPDWTADMPPRQCTINSGGAPLDIVHSDVFVPTCTSEAVPDDIGVFTGPVMPFVFIVPDASAQRALTAEEAYFLWGFGQTGQIEPWTDEAFLFSRPNTSGTKLTMAANIGVPGTKWKGTQLQKSSDVLNAVASAANPNRAVGILGGGVYDANRDTVKALAFQAFDQRLAYFPDSTATAFDKRNVRDGHYLLWGPAIFLSSIGSDGRPSQPAAAYVLDLLSGRSVSPTPSFDPVSAIIDQGLIPTCAMQVSRASQGGDLSRFDPEEPCHCFFESQVGTAGPECLSCDDNNPCASGVCRLGYCEAR